MRLKVSRFGRFYGCSTWSKTKCRGAVAAHDDGTPFGKPVPTGSKEKAQRRKRMQRRENPPTRWERLRENGLFEGMTDEEIEEVGLFGWPGEA